MKTIAPRLDRFRPSFTQARLWAQFLAGMCGFGLTIALMIRSGLGLGPWDAFHVGLHNVTGVTVGLASILTGLLIVAGMAAAGEPPRLATIVNMFATGVFLDLLLPYVPAATGALEEVAYSLAAIALAGISSGLYISTGLGKGARDGLTMWLSLLRGVPVRQVRLVIELTVLTAGWAMGGTIGVGTVLFSLLIGPSMERGLRLFGIDLAPPAPAGTPPARRRAA